MTKIINMTQVKELNRRKGLTNESYHLWNLTKKEIRLVSPFEKRRKTFRDFIDEERRYACFCPKEKCRCVPCLRNMCEDTEHCPFRQTFKIK